jgi:hypothetical protein
MPGIRKKRLFHFLPPVLAMVFICLVVGVPCAKFYKYVDKHGNLRFADELEKIPEEYRKDSTEYRESGDFLSEEQKDAERERQRRMEKLRKEAQAAEEQRLIEQRRREEMERRKIEREKLLNSLETKVIVRGNQILVPVKLGYAGNEIETVLLLDTGASNIVIHREIADQLRIKSIRWEYARVAGGRTIRVRIANLDYVRIGPLNMGDAYVSIVRHEGAPVEYHGFLGMAFLRNIKYTVDYKNQVIRWEPEQLEEKKP